MRGGGYRTHRGHGVHAGAGGGRGVLQELRCRHDLVVNIVCLILYYRDPLHELIFTRFAIISQFPWEIFLIPPLISVKCWLVIFTVPEKCQCNDGR